MIRYQRRQVVLRGATLFIVVAGLLLLPSALADATIGPTSEHLPAPAMKDRAPHLAVLSFGQRGPVKWVMRAFRGPGSAGGKTPCIEEVDLIYRGITSGRDCGPLAPPAKEPIRTEFSASLPAGVNGRKVNLSIFGMIFGMKVSKVVLDLSSGPPVTRRTHIFTAWRAKKVHMRQFRFIAFNLARKACVVEITGLNADGDTVLQTAPEPCL